MNRCIFCPPCGSLKDFLILKSSNEMHGRTIDGRGNYRDFTENGDAGFPRVSQVVRSYSLNLAGSRYEDKQKLHLD